MRFDGLLFDKDGTLFDFQATWSGWFLNVLAQLSQGDLTKKKSWRRRLILISQNRHFSRIALQ